MDLAVWLFALWSVTLVLRGHLPYIRHPFENNVDEGYAMAIGQRMLHGHMLPFVDGVAHSGPMFLFSSAFIAAFGEFSWVPIRVAAATSFAGITALTFLCGRAAGFSLAGAIASVGIPLMSLLRFTPIDGISYNAECPVNLFALASLTCAMHALRTERASLRWVAWAGVFAACTGLSKQIGGLQATAIAVGVLASTFGHPTLSRTQRWRTLASFVGGALVPTVLVLGWFAVHGALGDFYYYLVTYNHEIYMYHLRTVSRGADYMQWFEARPLEVGLLVASVSWGLAQPVFARASGPSFREALGRKSFPLTVSLLALAGIVGSRASLRDFDHYYMIAIPWFGLLAGLIAESSIRSFPQGSRLQQFGSRAVLLLPIVCFCEVLWSMRSQHLVGWSSQLRNQVTLDVQAQEPAPCKLIQKHTKPEQPIFVWGFRADLYVSCKRRPASRYVFTSFVAGYVPWYHYSSKEQEDSLAVPGSRKILLTELEANKPPIIVDSGRSLGDRSMVRYDELAAYLLTHYQLLEVIDGEPIYLRRS